MDEEKLERVNLDESSQGEQTACEICFRTITADLERIRTCNGRKCPANPDATWVP